MSTIINILLLLVACEYTSVSTDQMTNPKSEITLCFPIFQTIQYIVTLSKFNGCNSSKCLYFMSNFLLKLAWWILLSAHRHSHVNSIKRLCIFGPKGAIQICYYYYYYYYLQPVLLSPHTHHWQHVLMTSSLFAVNGIVFWWHCCCSSLPQSLELIFTDSAYVLDGQINSW